jgi:hypothetical protein
MKRLFLLCLLPIAYCIFLSSCKKDSFITSTDARLATSIDSLKYDTVFTTTGSITKSFKIFNLNDQKLKISKVKLMGGATSSYKMNVDGIATTEANNIEVAANDSIYVFVTVTINPNAANLPFIVADSIQINYNGNTRFIQLEAYGQNAIFIRNRVITGNVTWTNALPYVILGYLRVDTTASLTLQPGTRIYSHADAPFIVDGILTINGTKTDSVVFAGDRLDTDYKDLPASWPGIYYRGTSKNNVMTFARIKNAFQAVVVSEPSINATPKLVMHQSIIDNAYDAGILAINSSVQADNCLITNCGSNIYLTYGGNYSFTHCTVVGYSTDFVTHRNPVLTINNYSVQPGGTLTANLNAIFRNNIFWSDGGFLTDEISITKQGSTTFSILFDKNIYRMSADPTLSTLSGNIRNQDPSFDSIDVFKNIFDFHITKNAFAPGIDKGTPTGLPKDLDDKNRNVGLPDLGCYEKQ